MAASRRVAEVVTPFAASLLHLGQHCIQRASTPAFARVVKEQVVARTAIAVQLLDAPTLQPYLASQTAESLLTWDNLQSVCKTEEVNARELPDVKPNASNLHEFLDALQGLSSRRDVLAMLLTMSSSGSGASSIVSSYPSDEACVLDDAWQSTFLATRMKWHMVQEDFLHISSGTTPVVDAQADVIALVEEAAVSIHDMCVGEFGVSPNVEIETNCNELLFCGIPDQIRYIIAELLKNASVASVQSGNLHDPVKVQILTHAATPITASTCTASTADTFSVTIVDSAGGVPPTALQNMWRLGWSGHNTQRRIAGFGVGLPLAGIYAGLFGGCVTATPTLANASPGTMFTLMHPLVGIEAIS
jgi:signal transduction histidine kinase